MSSPSASPNRSPLRAIALLSGGLDSMLAIRVMLEQGVQVEAVNFQTIFTCCRETAAQAAHELGVSLTVISQRDDYLDLIRKPRYGYGKGANPCVDCRIYMFQMARQLADQRGAELVVSGEVLGQRPMSQKRRDLATIAHQSGLDERLLRPLSARLLPPTRAEREGRVDRARLFDFSGRGRKGLIALAHSYGFSSIPSPSTGCALTEPAFGAKVHDLVQLDPGSGRWDFELLKIGRHIRHDAATKVVVGRRAEENDQLARAFHDSHSRASALLAPEGFTGPTALVIGPATSAALEFAGQLVLRYSHPSAGSTLLRVETPAAEPQFMSFEPAPLESRL